VNWSVNSSAEAFAGFKKGIENPTYNAQEVKVVNKKIVPIGFDPTI
jgi:hypothetical protein